GVMVGIWGMAPGPVDLSHTKLSGEALQKEHDRIKERFEAIGMRMMNRTRGSADFQGDPIASVLRDPFKVKIAAQFLGQAFVIAYIFIKHNKQAVERIADRVLEKQEIFGDDLNRLLDSVNLKRPEIDWTNEETWPQI